MTYRFVFVLLCSFVYKKSFLTNVLAISGKLEQLFFSFFFDQIFFSAPIVCFLFGGGGEGGQKLKNNFWPIFSPFQAIWNKFDFFLFLTTIFCFPSHFFLGGGGGYCNFFLKKLFICVILMLYSKFQSPTMPGTCQKVCVRWCGGVVVWWWYGGNIIINELTNSHVTVVTWIFWFILTLTLVSPQYWTMEMGVQ